MQRQMNKSCNSVFLKRLSKAHNKYSTYHSNNAFTITNIVLQQLRKVAGVVELSVC